MIFLSRVFGFLLSLISLTVLSHGLLDATNIEDSLFGQCKNNLVYFNGTTREFLDLSIPHDHYILHRLPVNTEELLQYRAVPEIYTWIHRDLAVGLMKGIEQGKIWASRSDLQWQVAADHPRNNKSNCMRIAQLAVDRPIQLYQTMRQNIAEMYLVRKKNVLVHDVGITASNCGYLQMVDGCETKFKFIGRKWWMSCKVAIRDAKLRWEDLFNPRLSPLLVSNHQLSTNNTTSNDSLAAPSILELCRDKSYWNDITRTVYPHWRYYEKVIVVTALWDSNYHHFLVDTLLRLIPILDYVQAHPTIPIHIRRTETELSYETFKLSAVRIRQSIGTILSIDPARFISGPIIAGEVLVPRMVKCNAFIANALEFRQLARALLVGAQQQVAQKWNTSSQGFNAMPLSANPPSVPRPVEPTSSRQLIPRWYPAQSPFVVHQTLSPPEHSPRVPKRILIQYRVCQHETISHSAVESSGDQVQSKQTRRTLASAENTGTKKNAPKNAKKKKKKNEWRCWKPDLFDEILRSLMHSFPHAEIISLADTNATVAKCLACELVTYPTVDLLVGVHGAGITNLMMMAPGSLLLEIVGVFDGRMLPVCGYHGPLAAIFGVHHLIHYYDWKGGKPLSMQNATDKALRFFSWLATEGERRTVT